MSMPDKQRPVHRRKDHGNARGVDRMGSSSTGRDEERARLAVNVASGAGLDARYHVVGDGTAHAMRNGGGMFYSPSEAISRDISEAIDPDRAHGEVTRRVRDDAAPRWVMRKGRSVRPCDMTPEHLWRAILCCERSQMRERIPLSGQPIYAAMVAELTKREGRIGILRRVAKERDRR